MHRGSVTVEEIRRKQQKFRLSVNKILGLVRGSESLYVYL